MNMPDISDINGYKIPRGHFKLGSKLHLSDFYFARVMFQNSYFANRFAFLLASYITKSGLLKPHGKQIAVIGYGKYSEQLTDRLIKLLKTTDSSITFETDLVSDAEDLRLLKKNPAITNKFHFLIVIPIASTLSTSVKIIEHLVQRFKIPLDQVISPLFSPLMVMDKLAETKLAEITPDNHGYTPVPENNSTPYYAFHWKRIHKNKKQIEFYTQAGHLLEQKYLISLYTDWHPVHDCKICFPPHFLEERPLIDTDKVSVSPNLLLSEQFNFSQVEWPVKLLDRYHSYDNFRFSNKTYLHFINPNIFIIDHGREIKHWLESLRSHPMFSDLDSNKVVILSPEGNLNSSFSSLVNQYLFNDKASVIQFNIRTDYIENFIEFYHSEIQKASHVFYADDLLTLGKSFSAVNNFVKLIRTQSKGIDAVLIMVSRADNLALQKLDQKLNKSGKENVFRFLQLNVPDVAPLHLPCPVETTYKNYGKLAEGSNLDTIKVFYLNRQIHLLPKIELPEKNNSGLMHYDSRLYFEGISRVIADGNFKSLKHHFTEVIISQNLNKPYPKNFRKLLVTHILYSLRDFPKQCENYSTFADLDLTYISQRLKTIGFTYSEDNEKNSIKIKEYLIKVLSLPPFTNYQHIRKFIMSAMIAEIEYTLDQISGNPGRFRLYRYLKLLIKRLATLKSNYLISENFLTKINEMYSLLSEYQREARFKNRKLEQINLISFCNTLLQQELPQEDLLPFSIDNYTKLTLPEIKVKLEKYLKRLPVSSVALKLDLPGVRSNPHLPAKSLLRYCFQLILNNEYRNKLYREFEYFITACINEVIFDNEAKALHLEKNLNAIVASKSDFQHLKRILLLMNDGIFEEILPRIAKFPLQNHEMLISSINKVNKSYEYKPLFDFLEVNESGGYIQFHQPFSIFIKAWMDLKRYNEKPGNHSSTLDISGEIKIFLKTIKEFFKENEPDISLTVSTRYPQEMESIPQNQAYTFHINKKERTPSSESFIFTMLNGIQMQLDGPVQTIFEMYMNEDSKKWTSLKRKYFVRGHELDFDKFEEFSEGNYAHVVFIRIADFHREETTVINKGQGVLFLGFKRTAGDYISSNILRYLLLLRRELSVFIKLNSENDSFRSYIEASKKVDILSHFQHALKENKTTIEQILAAGEKGKDLNLVKTIMNASFNQVFLAEEFINSVNNTYNPIKLTKISVYDFMEKYALILQQMLIAPFGEGDISKYKIRKELNPPKDIFFLYDIKSFNVIMTEIFKNMKTHLYRVKEDRECFIRLNKTNKTVLEIGNRLSDVDVVADLAIKKLKNLKDDGGIRLIQRIYESKFDRKINVTIDKEQKEVIYQINLNTHVQT